MSTTTPSIASQQEKLGATFLEFGPAPHSSTGTAPSSGASGVSGASGGEPVKIVETFGQFQAEYAAIRQRVAILHEPQRGVLRFTGKDTKDFLHRLTTQDIRGMKGGDSKRTFQLNDKGRIIADVMVHHGDLDTWLEGDRFDLPGVAKLLESRVFSEDMVIEDWRDQRVSISVIGPATLPLLRAMGMEENHPILNMPGTHHVLHLCGSFVSAYRHDSAGVPGVRLLVPTADAARIHADLIEAAGYEDAPLDPLADPKAAADAAAARRTGLRGRPIGWLAYNTARIEAGYPLYHIDFGSDSLPAETSLLDQAVSFTKGCYLGQEIVARMQHLGHPKRVLVGIRCADDRLPIAGAQVMEAGGTQGNVIGAVTSSTLSPMLGSIAIGFASVKWGFHEPGTEVTVAAEGQLVTAKVQGLKFLT